MTSMRKLKRRLARWRRYVHRYRHLSVPPGEIWRHLPPGYWRAKGAVDREEERRFWAETPEIHLVGLPDHLRCCLAGDAGHDGPCVIRCDGCTGNGACPECGGVDDLGCWHCDGTGSCPHGCDDGEIVLEEWTPARIPAVVTVPVDRGLL